jgi:hypothetical protein
LVGASTFATLVAIGFVYNSVATVNTKVDAVDTKVDAVVKIVTSHETTLNTFAGGFSVVSPISLVLFTAVVTTLLTKFSMEYSDPKKK